MNNTSTLLSVALFASLQVAMYFVYLLKIREVARQPLPPLVKLKLMENGEPVRRGLHLGIAGIAAALVLQVMQVIESNSVGRVRLESLRHYLRGACKIHHVRAQTAADPQRRPGDHA